MIARAEELVASGPADAAGARVRVRFAPSPTGSLHIGNAHTALFNWLFARHEGGRFILRIEDTDAARSARQYEWEIAEDLRWLGLDWDEGPDKGGPYGPYRQSERLPVYAEFAARLEESGAAYRCYCTPEELDADRQSALNEGGPSRYSRRCRRLTRARRAEMEAAGRRAALRFDVEAAAAKTSCVTVVDDLIRGPIRFDLGTLGDFVIVRSDGMPTYNFAVVVDDLLMGITHVLRADEHIANTPRQMLVYEALGRVPPRFAHVSMILGPDRTKLSKRHGATSVSAYRMEGYPPKALLNHLALLGWTPPAEYADREVFEVDELVRLFTLDQVGKSPSVFDVTKLNWVAGKVIREAPLEEVVSQAAPFLIRSGLVTPADMESGPGLARVARAVDVMRGYVSKLSDLPGRCELLLARDAPEPDPAAREALAWEGSRAALGALAAAVRGSGAGPGADLDDPRAVHDMLLAIPDRLGQSRKRCLTAIRAALTGRTSGPELHLIVWALGAQATARRLESALERRW